MTCVTNGTRCATAAQIINFIPDLETYGGTSKGTITLLGETTAGDTIVIGGKTLTAVTGSASANEWSVDGDEYSELDSIVTAINLSTNDFSEFVEAEVRTPGLLIINLESISTGLYSNIPMSASGSNIELSGTALSGGECDLEFFLETACSMINSACFGTKTLAASMYLAAHLIEMANGQDGGIQTSRSIAAISEGFSVMTYPQQDAYFANTKWGRLYLALWRTILKMPGVSGGLLPRTWPGFGRRRW